MCVFVRCLCCLTSAFEGLFVVGDMRTGGSEADNVLSSVSLLDLRGDNAQCRQISLGNVSILALPLSYW